MKRIAGTIMTCLIWGVCLCSVQPACAEDKASSPTAWKTLAPGLEMVFLSADETVRSGSGQIAVLRF